MIRIEPWSDTDLELLRRINAPEMKRYLGGPETEEQVVARHRRYLEIDEKGQMFRIVLLPEDTPVGSVGFWEREWQGGTVYEMGWSVLPGFQGRGIAVAAVTAAAGLARAEHKHESVHAFPSVEKRRFERGLPQGGLRSHRRVRLRVPTREHDAVQRLETRSQRRTSNKLTRVVSIDAS